MYSGFGLVGSPNRSVPGATGTVERSAEAMTTPRRGPVRLAPLFAAALRMPGDIARGVRSLPAEFRAFRQFQDGLRQSADEDMLDRYFGPAGHAGGAPGADEARPCWTGF